MHKLIAKQQQCSNPWYKDTLVIVRTTSVEVAIGFISPVILYPTTFGTTILIACPNITASASMPPTPGNKIHVFVHIYETFFREIIQLYIYIYSSKEFNFSTVTL